MDPSPSPPDLLSPDQDMALVVSNGLPSQAANKRYRPSPAKTFQCRGYGECRMVFSRSEHLARHIRKHTGERPFSCHCSKQFSRLDNLRQHAQTVHADKQDDNERMMRDLTSLHATMSAANKLGGVRTTRKTPNAGTSTTNGGNSASGPLILIKQEDVAHQRPDTSTGYESGEAMYRPSGSSFRDQNHSFREPSQSFLAPPSTGAAHAANNQSFLAYPRAHFQASDPSDRPGASSRPSTASGLADPHPRSLPPLAAVVSASLSSPQTPPSPGPHSSTPQQHHLQQQQQQSLLPFPSSLAHYRRSSTHRPGTAPASASLFARSSFPDRSRLGSSSGRPDLSLLHSGFAGRPFGFVDHLHQQFSMGDSSDLSPSPGNDPSPFFFNPPVSATAAAATTTTGSSPVPVNSNPRKRPFGGPDGPSDDSNQLRADRPTSSAGPFSELNYEYGSESRPQSRRLTVMELCNDDEPRPSSQRRGEQQQQQQHSSTSSPFLLSTPPPPPTTSSGLVSSTSTLRLFDRAASPGSTQQPTTVFPRTSYAATGAVGDGVSGGRGAKEGGRRGSSTSFGVLSSDSPEPTFSNRTTSPSYTPPAILSTSNSASDSYSNVVSQRQQHQQYYPKQSHHSPKFFPNSPAFSTTSNDSSCSPRSPLSDSSAGGSPYPSYAHTSTRTTATTSPSISVSAAAAAASSATSVYATGHGHGHGHISSSNAHTSSGISAQSHHLHHHHHHHRQRDAQVRASVSPHPGFGMRV